MKSFSVLFTAEARIDSLEGYNWYAEKSPEIAKNFQKCLDAKLIFTNKPVSRYLYL